MNKRAIFFVPLVVLASCTGNPPSKTPPVDAAKTDTSKVIFSDKAESKIDVFKDGDAWVYKAADVHYKIESFPGNPFGDVFAKVLPGKDIEYYIVKYTTETTASQGSETDDKMITAEIRPVKAPAHQPVILKQKCDKMELEDCYYRITKYGCCGGDDAVAFYDFQNNLVIAGDARIVRAEVPNSDIKFFCAYKTNFNDSLFLGSVFFSYGSADKYEIKIKASPQLPQKCNYQAPVLFLQSKDPRDNVAGNGTCELWSQEKIKDKNQLNNLSLKLAFECTSEEKLDTVEIPVVNGKPFGADSRLQNYTLPEKERRHK